MAFVVTLLAAVIGSLAWGALREARAAQRTIAELRFELAALRFEIASLAAQLEQLQLRQGAPAPQETAAPAEAEAPVEAAAPALSPVLPPAAPEPLAPEPPPPPAEVPEPLLTQPSFSSSSPPPTPTVSLEERLGARAFVWIGAIALALAGAFLVKYSVDQGWIGPAVRFALAVLFGVVLLGAGEVLRHRAERIAAGLSAAGIAVLFAAWLAGTNLYGLLAPALGFAFIGLTALVAVWLSLRQGVIVALVGLVGGFLTPAWIGAAEPDPRLLFGYLLFLQLALLAVSRRRLWTGVPELALGAGFLWVLGWVVAAFAPGDALWLGLFLLGMFLIGVVLGRDRSVLPALAAGGGLLGMALVAGRAGYGPLEWGLLAVLAAATLVLARLREELHALAWLACAAVVGLLLVWGWDLPAPEAPRFLWTALAMGALCAGGAYLAHWGAARPDRWTGLAAFSGVAVFLVAWASVRGEGEWPDLPWGALALAAAALYLVAALPVARRRAAAGEGTPLDATFAWLAVAVTAFVSLAVPLELERHWWTVAWALEVPALVWLAGRFGLPMLRRLAAALAAAVAVRLLLNPYVLGYAIGPRPVLNWLLYGYGVPLLAVAGAAALARRDPRFGPGRLAAGLEALAVALAFALVTLEVRQAFHPGALARGEPTLAECATYAVAWLLLGLGLLALDRRSPRLALELGGQAGALGGLAMALFGCGFLLNPLWRHAPVGGTPVANLLLWCYGAPAVLAALAGRALRRRGPTWAAVACSTGALVLTFLLVALEVTQAFHGTFLDDAPATVAEKYAYSLAWLLFGIALLVLGIARRVRALRYASLAAMALTVVKVFLFDMGNLTDLWRVLSFLGLGVALLLLAFLYQRFVFREPAT
ncbi:MAG TPA: DUF2339 domain-containing protein [Thermoanaerobaculia bacterium]|nr:DUF2339 domain-containing protein [Thermoanaerobaculia bacterium]